MFPNTYPSRTRLAIVLVTLMSCTVTTTFLSPSASAERRQRTPAAKRRLANQLLQRGLQYLSLGKQAEAIKALQLSYAFWPRPRVLTTLGQAYELAERLEEARSTYRRALRIGGPRINVRFIQARLSAIETKGPSSQPASSQPASTPPTSRATTDEAPPAAEEGRPFPADDSSGGEPDETPSLELRGQLENQSQVGWANGGSIYNPDNQVLKLPVYNNVTRLRSVFKGKIWDRDKPGALHQRISFYTRVFGELQSSPATSPISRTAQHYVFQFDELYADYELGKYLYILLGKKRINWGHGFFMNPVDAVNPLKDVTDPIHSLEGAPMALVEVMLGPVTLSALYTHELPSPLGRDAVNWSSSRGGGSLGLLAWGLEAKLYAFGGQGERTMFGAALRRAIGQFVLYGEYALRLGSDRIYVEDDGSLWKQDKSTQSSLLAGLSYSFLSSSFITGEFVYDQSGWSRRLMQNFFGQVRTLLPTPEGIPQPLLDGSYGNLSQLYAGLSFSHQIREVLDLELRVLASLSGVSFLTLPAVQYLINDLLTLRLEYLSAFGQHDAEYTNAPFSHRIQAYLILNY